MLIMSFSCHEFFIACTSLGLAFYAPRFVQLGQELLKAPRRRETVGPSVQSLGCITMAGNWVQMAYFSCNCFLVLKSSIMF